MPEDRTTAVKARIENIVSRTIVATALRAFLDRHSVEGGIVVACSGGPDSLALLAGLHELQGDRLLAAHLNHQLRGAESDADEAFVAEFCTRNHIEVCVERCDVRGTAEKVGDNLEATARRMRYDWLLRVAQEQGKNRVATGHTAGDQAETVLHHLLRGTGLRGLRGIARRRPLGPGVELIRPLLKVSRADVEAFLAERGLQARHDASNDDRTLTRNRLRHELLPLLRATYNPAIDGVLGRLAEQAADLHATQEAEARSLLEIAERPRAGSMLVLDAALLAAAPRQIVRELLHVLWEREGWPLDPMGYEEWERVAALAAVAEGTHDLPGRVRACRVGRVLQLRRE